MAMDEKIFISYVRADSDFALKLAGFHVSWVGPV
jgi:hypothetical protein